MIRSLAFLFPTLQLFLLAGQSNMAGRGQSRAMTQRYSHLTPASLDSTIRLLDNRPIRRAVGDNLETPEGRNS